MVPSPSSGNEKFPDAGGTPKTHGMHPPVPMIEIAYDADAAGVGCPHRKMNAIHTVDCFRMSAEFFVRIVMAALAHEIQIEFRQEKREGVGVVDFDSLAIFRVETNAVAGRSRSKFADVRERMASKKPSGRSLRMGSGSGAPSWGNVSEAETPRRICAPRALGRKKRIAQRRPSGESTG